MSNKREGMKNPLLRPTIVGCCLALFLTCIVLANHPVSATISQQAKQSHSKTTSKAHAVDGCKLAFAGTARKAVKLRTPDQNYPRANNGNPMTVADFLKWTCKLTKKVTNPVPS